ncbi:hypothetical protein KIN20_024517 [Parelaphostrongylus tenuis]|uniref:Uncharacterized protein n=1 Tax=Parelaphostrongylus tenuis TaxID=148309 RepID=A0AAD5QWS5_PARTN|nr:hypothetical protein KIN20_024517 [Parelaphostrongylus tenuis]
MPTIFEQFTSSKPCHSRETESIIIRAWNMDFVELAVSAVKQPVRLARVVLVVDPSSSSVDRFEKVAAAEDLQGWQRMVVVFGQYSKAI